MLILEFSPLIGGNSILKEENIRKFLDVNATYNILTLGLTILKLKLFSDQRN
jgi:hypothetical protein